MRAMIAAAACALALTAVASAQTDSGSGGYLRLASPALSVSGGGLSSLIKRADVQTGLKLNLRQRNELGALLREPNQIRVAVTMSEQDARDPDALQRQADEQVQAQLGRHDEKIKAILTDEQWNRLQQLALQWKGPLALAEPPVAKSVGFSREAAAQVSKYAAEYAATKSEVMASLARTQEDVSPDGSQRRVAARIDTSELDRRFSPARKKLLKAKAKAETSILGVLNPDELKRWAEACGKPFTFRSDIKGMRF